jgi:hypothetical protein
VISGFCCEVDKNCTLLGYYSACSGNSLLMIQENLLVPYLRDKVDLLRMEKYSTGHEY